MAHPWPPPLLPHYGNGPANYPIQFMQPPGQHMSGNGPAPAALFNQQYPPHIPAAANLARFQSNNHHVPSPNKNSQFSSGGFDPQLFHHFPPSNLPNLPPPPPPGYPPLPLPGANFPPFPPQTSTPTNFPPQYYHPQTFQNKGGSAPYQYPAQRSSNDNFNHAYRPENMNRDDGELSDGELDDNRATSNSVDSSTRPVSVQKGNAAGSTFQTKSVDIQAPILSDGEDSASSYNPPSASTPDNADRSPPTGPVQAPDGSKGHAEPVSSRANGVTSKYYGRGAFEMRELAKGALLSLAPHNINFMELREEGVDAQLLTQLYDELGLKTIPAGRVDFNIITENEPAGREEQKDQYSTNSEQEASFSNTVKSGRTQGQDSVTSLQASQQASLTTTPLFQSTKQANPAKHTQPGETVNATVIQPVPSPSMERKDRIAQLLAAKTGKLPRRDSSNTISPDTAKAETIPSTPVSKDTIQPIHSRLSNLPLLSPSNTAPESTPKPKNKAQTELVRQKMEQLKKEAQAKAQTFNLPKSIGASSVGPASSTTAPRVTTAATQQITTPYTLQKQTPVPNVTAPINDSRLMASNAMPLGLSSFIPGLFMTESEANLAQARELTEYAADLPANAEDFPIRSVSSELASTPSEDVQPELRSRGLPRLDFSTLSREPSTSRVPQKRALASDAFDEHDSLPSKHHFARRHSSQVADHTTNEEPMEEMSDGEIMEIDDESLVSPRVDAPAVQSISTPSIISAQPPLPLSPPAPLMTQPSVSAAVVPPLLYSRKSDLAEPKPQIYAKTSATESWRIKQDEIEAMRKKIEEMEKRRKAKQTHAQASSPASSDSTPAITKPSSPAPLLPTDNTTPMKVADQPASVMGTQSIMTERPPSVPSPLSRASPTLAQKGAALKAEALRQRTLRKKMLKEGLPELDAEVQKTQSRQAEAQARLAQLRQEAERREKEAREARIKEQEILEEVKRLEQQLEIGISGHKQYTDEMESLDQENTKTLTSSSVEVEEITEDPSHLSLATATPVESDFDDLANLESKNVEPLGLSAVIEEEFLSAEEAGFQASTNDALQVLDDCFIHATSINPFSFTPNATSIASVEVSVDAVLEGENMNHETEPSEQQSMTFDPEVSMDAYNRESSQGESPMDVDSDSDGSASMSDSGSEEDYEPAEPVTVNGADEGEVDEDMDDEYDPNDAPIAMAPAFTTEEGADDYEPAEVVEAMELPTSNATSNSPEQGNISPSEAICLESDREHGLELTEANTLIKTQEMPLLVADSVISDSIPTAHNSSTSRFRPYQSVLSNFKSYRFHSQFTEHVPEGYRSLTYSYNIDPSRPLCPTEAMGQMCSDIDCEEQHFRQMSLADENILIQLSSANDIPHGSQRDQFVAGLKVVVADLRNKNIHDFDQVASELAAYRRRFRKEQYPALAQTENTS